eukprot:TRINITY_DN10377_c0_g1_i2.p2 TRINITY_DN10377_c0_g1~~TRINITY_DN10377_c0_g1_i2.p2  ORF type:complete len:115 (-),score=31.43 TRINITY_DN10377_c0_g1_i2:90-434(-)
MDEFLSYYRKASIFSPENEIRALAGYYSFVKSQIKSYPKTIEQLKEALKTLQDEEKQIKPSDHDKIKSSKRRQNVVKESMDVLRLLYQQLKLASMKLGMYQYVKLQKIVDKVLY